MTYIALAVAAVLVGIDQLTKWLAVTYVKPLGTIPLIVINDKEWLNFTYQENRGAAFSSLQDKQLFLIIATSILLLGLIVLLLSKRVKNKYMILSIGVIIGGGIGNLIDRIANGFVVDFIDFRIIRFAVFNFADICAVVGSITLFLLVFFSDIKQNKANKALKNEESGNSEDE